MGGKSAIHDIGKKFGRLTVVGVDVTGGHAVVTAACDCGGTWVGRISPLRSGATSSCGCLVSEATTSRNTTHGGSGIPEYKVWKGMRRRCNDPRHKDYAIYGGKGIKVCERWDDFALFMADMGSRPSQEHSIERLKSDKDYEPDNCKWATALEQARNTSRVVRYDYGGQRLTLREISEKCGVPYFALRSRIYEGWSLEAATTTPVQRTKAGELIEHDGKKMTLTQWAKHLGVGATTLHYRLSHGWGMHLVLTSKRLK